MDRCIIINADDFGLTKGINKAVRQAHSEGVLTSTTLMANMPAAQQAVEIAKELPRLGVGVHLNLLEGQPVSNESSVKQMLCRQGRFVRSAAALAVKAALSKNVRKAIKIELEAQIRRVIDYGIKPTHLDSHKHIHCFPCIFPIVCGLAESLGSKLWPQSIADKTRNFLKMMLSLALHIPVK